MNRLFKMKTLFAFATAGILFASCNPVKKHTYLGGDIKADFGFREGTYWVYVDSATGATDSVWVTSINTDVVTIPETGETERMTVSLKHNYNGEKVFGMYQITAGVSNLFSFNSYNSDTVNYYTLINYGYTDIVMGDTINHQIYGITSKTPIFRGASNALTIRPTDGQLAFYQAYYGVLKFSIRDADSTGNHVWEILRYNLVH